jgi:hypothetical protein
MHATPKIAEAAPKDGLVEAAPKDGLVTPSTTWWMRCWRDVTSSYTMSIHYNELS